MNIKYLYSSSTGINKWHAIAIYTLCTYLLPAIIHEYDMDNTQYNRQTNVTSNSQ